MLGLILGRIIPNRILHLHLYFQSETNVSCYTSAQSLRSRNSMCCQFIAHYCQRDLTPCPFWHPPLFKFTHSLGTNDLQTTNKKNCSNIPDTIKKPTLLSRDSYQGKKRQNRPKKAINLIVGGWRHWKRQKGIPKLSGKKHSLNYVKYTSLFKGFSG